MSFSALLAIVGASLTLSSCMPSLAARAEADLKSARAEAERLPGAKQVLGYAIAFERAVELESFGKRVAQRDAVAEDVIGKLTRVIDSEHPDSPLLVAHRGVIQCILGRCDEGEADLERAHASGPSAYSTYWLVLRHGRKNRTTEVARVCSQAVPRIEETRRYDLIGHCREQMNAATVETSMSWADRETFAWYLREMDHRDRVEAAETVRREQAAAERRGVEREVEMCSADCRERALRCQNKCREQVPCLNRCIDIDNACRQGCVADGNRKLGL